MNKVINFHDVKDAAWFEKVVGYLKRKYSMISARDLYDFYYNKKKLHNACLITVDDGHSSSYEIIYPILKKHHVPAIFFVSPKIAKREEVTNFWFQEIEGYDEDKLLQIGGEYLDLGKSTYSEWIKTMKIDDIWKIISKYQELCSASPKTPQNMTVEQIRQIDKEGLVEIGAHTLAHPILANETRERAKEEIVSSINQLGEMLQHPILTFAYPNGRPVLDFGEREELILKDTSVKLAFSTRPHNFSKSDDVLAIPRYGLTIGSLNFIKLKLFLGRYYPLLRRITKH